ncbi:MAG: ABC transporter ATP-binding protein [Streptosporangiaceae bacterium]
MLLQAKDLAKSFGSTPALHNASLDLGEGDVLAVMGPSGSGKSTLLHCLAGILVPDSGSVQYRGQEISRLPDAKRSALRRGEFGFVFQFGQLVAELTTEENVALPLLLGRTMKRRAALEQARSWLDRFDLAKAARRRPGELSGGQAQRVAVARAMIQRPRVIFADEPTGSLDTATGREVLLVLTEAARDHGVSVVLVTHDSRVAAHADRTIVVEDGRTVNAGRAPVLPGAELT